MIKINHLKKTFGNNEVLTDINQEVKKGEVVVIIGPSGSGKSTLLRCLNLLETPTSGEIIFEGTALTGLNETKMNQLREKMGMVFQNFNLFPHMTVLENLKVAPIKVKGTPESEAHQTAIKLLEQVGLSDKAEAYPSNLSGGQQQRVAIARGLAMGPSVLLFDEPTSALDPETIEDVLDVMKKLAKEGMTMIVVTHEMGFAREVADRVIFMADGEVLEDRETVSFFENPKDERAKQFLSKIINH